MTGWKSQCEAAAAELTQPQRQSVLDHLRQGRSIGQVQDILDLPLSAVCGVLDQNIRRTEVLQMEYDAK